MPLCCWFSGQNLQIGHWLDVHTAEKCTLNTIHRPSFIYYHTFTLITSKFHSFHPYSSSIGQRYPRKRSLKCFMLCLIFIITTAGLIVRINIRVHYFKEHHHFRMPGNFFTLFSFFLCRLVRGWMHDNIRGFMYHGYSSFSWCSSLCSEPYIGPAWKSVNHCKTTHRREQWGAGGPAEV